MPCPKCKSINVIKAGKYYIERTNKPRFRFKCKDCNSYFTLRGIQFKKKIPLRIRKKIFKKILKLWKTKKPYIRKYDSSKKRTYSTREIALKLGVSKSFVHNVIKKKNAEY